MSKRENSATITTRTSLPVRRLAEVAAVESGVSLSRWAALRLRDAAVRELVQRQPHNALGDAGDS